MKKCMVSSAVLLIALMLFSSVAMAEGKEAAYGTEKVSLTLADDLDEVEIGTAMFGSFACDGEAVVISTSDAADCYDVALQQAPGNTAVFTGKKYFVMEVLNNSDGDIYFSVMPRIEGSTNLFLRSNDTTKTVLVDTSGVMQEAVWTDEASVSGRYGFTLPYEFEGYIFIPFSSICEHNQWDTSYLQEAAPLTHLGMHAANYDSSYIEVFVYNLYTADALPAYTAPPTQAPTQTPEATTPPASPEGQKTAAPQATETVTAKATAKAAEPSSSGNSTTIIIIACAAAAVIAAVIIIAVISKKKKRQG